MMGGGGGGGGGKGETIVHVGDTIVKGITRSVRVNVQK